MEMLFYIGKVSLYWVLFYTCYQLFLRKQTFFTWNRLYLVSALLVSFALPLVIYPESAPDIPVIYEVSAATFSVNYVQPQQVTLFTWGNAAILCYILVVLHKFFNLFGSVRQLRSFIREGELIELEDCNLVLINSNDVGSFSFMKWIVVNRNDYGNHFDAILRHEMVHTSQGHSFDILFVEILRIIFWFNPVLLLYKKSLQEVHEYLADEAAPNREHYANFLVNYSLNAPIAALTNHFFKPSQLKSRVEMIYKNRTSKWFLSTYLLALTTIGLIAILIAGCEQKPSAHAPDVKELAKPKNVVKTKSPEIGKVYTVVEEQPQFPGGIKEMYRFLGENIKYPEAAAKAGIEGRVFLSFVVTKTGEIQDITVLKGIGYGCDAEAVRVLKSFPNWTPARQDRIPVNVKYNLPIHFQMKSDKKVKILSEVDNAIGAQKEDHFSKNTTVPPGLDLNDVLYNKSGIRIIKSDEKLDPSVSPLYVVNGKIIDVGNIEELLARITPDEIETISVVKGHDSSSKYGSKGINGVVLIETKKAISK